MYFEEIAELVKAWSVKRGLDKANPVKQVFKLTEEKGELVQAWLKGRDDDFRDAIGDMVVVMAIYCQQVGIDFVDLYRTRYDVTPLSTIEGCLAEIELYSGQLSNATVNRPNLGFRKVYLRHILEDLQSLCDLTGNDLAVCFEMAYDEIKDRKGKLIDGIWVKEADLKPKGRMDWFRKVGGKCLTMLSWLVG